MMIAGNQVLVTAPALRADIANACSSFDHLGRTGEQCRGCGQAAPVQSLKRTRRPETRTLTSVMGHSRRLGLVGDMSGLPQTADISGPGRHFAFVPKAEVRCGQGGLTGPARENRVSSRHCNRDDTAAPRTYMHTS